MASYEDCMKDLKQEPKKWLVTGAAGFIGSNITEFLLQSGQSVVGLDNFATGHKYNLAEIRKSVTKTEWSRFEFIEGDIRVLKDCQRATKGADFVLHQAALGSVPRSIKDPISTNKANVDGFLNMLVASRDSNVSRFIYAASSSTYGDHESLPKVEAVIGRPLSPYAVTKYINELYADVFFREYGLETLGLRYFNVFGKRQDPKGAYAAVIPKWTAALVKGDDLKIFGDGKTSRDFCFIENVIQANILAATAKINSNHEVYNVAVGERTSLNELADILKQSLHANGIYTKSSIIYERFRDGDVMHSQADITKARSRLGYNPKFSIEAGIKKSMSWYIKFLK